MGRSMWVEALAAAGALMGCNAVLKIVSTSSSRVPASNLTGTAGVGPGSALVPELADVLTDVNFLGNLFVLFTVSFTFFLWALRPPRCRRRSGRSGLGVRRTRASPGALSRASTAPSTASEDELFSFEDELLSSDMSDGSSEMLRAGKGNIPVSNDSDLKHWDDVCVCVCRPDGFCRSGPALRAGKVHVSSGHTCPAGQVMAIMPSCHALRAPKAFGTISVTISTASRWAGTRTPPLPASRQRSPVCPPQP